MSEWKAPDGYNVVLNPLHHGYVDGFDPERTYRFLRWGEIEPSVYSLADIGPYFNVAGLYFAPLPQCLLFGAKP